MTGHQDQIGNNSTTEAVPDDPNGHSSQRIYKDITPEQGARRRSILVTYPRYLSRSMYCKYSLLRLDDEIARMF